MAACSRDVVRGMHGTESRTMSTADQNTSEQGKTIQALNPRLAITSQYDIVCKASLPATTQRKVRRSLCEMVSVICKNRKLITNQSFLAQAVGLNVVKQTGMIEGGCRL